MAYTTINKPSDYFNTKLYTGDGTSSNAITGVGFQPDLTWIKPRSDASLHFIVNSFDETKFLQSQSTSAELDATTDFVSLDSDGFTVKNTNDWTNKNSSTYASWNWLAGGTASSNTDGSISSSVSANTTSGFSIVSYTGTGSNATVGHGLGVAPSFIIIKNRSVIENWAVGCDAIAWTKYLKLNSTDGASTATSPWNNTAPTSSVFSIGTWEGTNASGNNYIAYCFAEKKGFSKFGSYTGNGSTDGTFIYTGFKPAFVIIKKSSASGDNWHTWDSTRDTFNVVNKRLVPNDSVQEYSNFNVLDFCSNGFKLRDGSTYWNQSGGTFIYMCFAENPLVGTNNVPTTAR